MFEYKENFLSPHIIAEFDKYCALNEADISSDDAWNSGFTKDNDNVECFTQKPTDAEIRLIKDDIFNNESNPFYKNKFVRNLCVSVQKYPQGAVLNAHKDRCVGSITVFLNKEWDRDDGGMFHWVDDNAEGNGFCVLPKYNSAVIVLPGQENINKIGQTHWVTEVLREDPRCCIQMFIWGEGDPNNTLYEEANT
tara:strand:- start:39 stop:620 length:582 start_codon:yes stop_codon:yes gene_type:complete